uniref:URI1 n=1 Tax=Toxocara canis TaxID=6265 RepID=A0A183U4X4_TOXCA
LLFFQSGTNVAASTPAPPVTITRPECFGEPTGLVKRRIRTITATGVDDVMPASPLAKESGSIRRPRRHDEYTSITDAIHIADLLPQPMNLNEKSRTYSEQSTMCCHATENDEEDEMVDEDDDEEVHEEHFDGTETPTTSLKRAKESFVRRQNSVLRE